MKRYKHKLSHYNLTTTEMGVLQPVGLTEVLPGDSFRHRTSAMMRLSPLVTPVMHPVMCRMYQFFVPTRLLWDGWEDFITGQDATPPPTVTLDSGANFSSLADALGLPFMEGADTLEVNSFAIRAYNLIYNKFFRDQDLQSEVDLDQLDLLRVNWEKDMFTAARPYPQKGAGDIFLPIGTRAPVYGIGKGSTSYVAGPAAMYETAGSATRNYASYANAGSDTFIEEDPNNAGYPDIWANLTGADLATIGEVRRAFALQNFEEARSMWGSEYTEYLAYLGIRARDSRLNRPEYLSGGQATISFSEILQTAEGSNPVGTLRGHGITGLNTRRYQRFFPEHGYVITLMAVRPKAIYADSADRHWFYTTKEDYFQKELVNIGNQAIAVQEVYAKEGNNLTVFGYGPRYEQYTRQFSRITRFFRDATSDLDEWHFGRLLGAQPTLNSAFITCSPQNRPFADQSGTKDRLYLMIVHDLMARRMVPRDPTPRIR